MNDPFIFGKDETTHIVSCEVHDDHVEIFREEDGCVLSESYENKYWMLSSKPFDDTWIRLQGHLHYKYIKYYTNIKELYSDKRRYKDHVFHVYDTKEQSMLINGFTYHKGMKVEDVSCLSFDIETTGLTHCPDSKVLLISNTFVKNGITTRRLFAYDDYVTEAAMIDNWCEFVRSLNPSILVGHNIFAFDLPYLDFCSRKAGTTLKLGRNASDIRFETWDSKFRKDGSQDYLYRRCYVYGREIIDTMFLAIHFDFARKYESYGLKQIIKQEKLEVAGRMFYDASLIHKTYKIVEEWARIKKYAIHDADDAMSLYKLMIPAYFYLAQSVPKSLQSINYTATGTQVNSFLIRSYLQYGYSIPKASQTNAFPGAISVGYPGRYNNVLKFDVSSLYPSIIRQYEIFDKTKDPKAHFLKMVDFFTIQRLEDKTQAKTTGDRYYKELEQSRKIFINSAYGLLGSVGLTFNSVDNASLVTERGRDILKQGIKWCVDNNVIISFMDTDSFSFSKQDGSSFTSEEQSDLLQDINSQFPDKIRWEYDGYFARVCVLKSKNYILYDGKTITKKGSSLKSSKIEKGFKDFMSEIIEALIFDKQDEVVGIYHKYIREVFNVKDIARYCSKKTVTEAVLHPERTTEQKILDAIGNTHVQGGDKVYVYFKTDGSLALQDAWSADTPDHCPFTLLKKLYKTLEIFANVLPIETYCKYHLKKNTHLLNNVLKN